MDDVVSGKVSLPSLLLILFGLLTMLVNLGSLGWTGFSAITILMVGEVDYFAFATSMGWQVAMSLFGVIAGVLIMVGGSRMRAQRSAGLVYASAAMAMLPCCAGWCCCFGLPIGAWVLVTMNDDQVKAAFEA